MLVVEDEDLRILAYSHSRRGLLQELEKQIMMLWDEYAMEDDNVLAPDGLELKRRLREKLAEAPMPRLKRDVETGLLRKGFRPSQGKHQSFHYWTLAGRKTGIRTVTSHGAREIHDPILAYMARECKLSRRDFDRLIDCPMSQQQYELTLHTSGALRP